MADKGSSSLLLSLLAARAVRTGTDPELGVIVIGAEAGGARFLFPGDGL